MTAGPACSPRRREWEELGGDLFATLLRSGRVGAPTTFGSPTDKRLPTRSSDRHLEGRQLITQLSFTTRRNRNPYLHSPPSSDRVRLWKQRAFAPVNVGHWTLFLEHMHRHELSPFGAPGLGSKTPRTGKHKGGQTWGGKVFGTSSLVRGTRIRGVTCSDDRTPIPLFVISY